MDRREAIRLLTLASPAAMAMAQAPANDKKPDPRSKMWNDLYSGTEPIVNPFPNRYLAQTLEGRKPGRALDIGMGQGRNTVFMATQGWDVTGVDISEKGVELARKAAEDHKVKINAVVSDFGTFDLGKSQWDLISEMYMHGMIIVHAKRVIESLRPGGLLAVEGFHQDSKLKGFNGRDLGFSANELLEAFVPHLRIVHYEEVRDFGDWSMNGAKVTLIRMLASRKG